MHRIFSLLIIAALMSAEISPAKAEVTTRLEISGDMLILSWSDSRDAVIFRRDSDSGYNVPPMKIDIPGKWTLDDSKNSTESKSSQNILPPGISGHQYTYTFSAKGRKRVRWSAKGLPDGLRISTSGRISGTPKESGVFSADITEGRETQKFTLKIFADGKPEILTNSLPDAKAGTPYDFRINMNDSPAFVIMAGEIPQGLTINDSGKISGTPKKPGDYTIDITAANSYGESSAKLSLKVSSPDAQITKAQTPTINRPPQRPKRAPRISSSSMKQAFTGEEYTFTLKVAGTEKVKWACDSLPEGLSLDSETGIISGIPVSDFKGKISVTAMNEDGEKSSRLIQFSIRTKRPQITTTILPEGFLSEDYRTELKAEGGKGITWSFKGKIPDGLSFSREGIIHGVPEKAGRFSLSASAENSGGKATRRFSLRVSENLPHEYLTAAIMPVITVSDDGRYDFPVSIDAKIPEGANIEFHSFPYGVEAEDENYTFRNSDGKETLTVPANHHVVVNAYLEGGVRYEPVITARVNTEEPKAEGEPATDTQPLQGTYSGCDSFSVMCVMMLMIMVMMILTARRSQR